MTFQFQLTEDDFVDAQLTHLRKTMAPSRWKLVLRLGIPVTFLICSAALTVVALVNHDMQLIKQVAPAGYVFLGLLLVTLYVWSGIPFRVQFRKLKAWHRPMEMVVGDDAVSYTSPTGEGRSRWEAFEAWRESKKSFLLYPQPRIFFIVPKRAMQPDQISVLRELLKSRIHNA